MASKSYQKYLDSVKLTPMSRYKLPQPDHEETLGELVAAGHKLLGEADPKPITTVTTKKSIKADDKKKLESKLASTSDNPYVRARIQILNKMDALARGVIEKMEKGELKKDRRYDEFSKAVMALGDQLSEGN